MGGFFGWFVIGDPASAGVVRMPKGAPLTGVFAEIECEAKKARCMFVATTRLSEGLQVGDKSRKALADCAIGVYYVDGAGGVSEGGNGFLRTLQRVLACCTIAMGIEGGWIWKCAVLGGRQVPSTYLAKTSFPLPPSPTKGKLANSRIESVCHVSACHPTYHV